MVGSEIHLFIIWEEGRNHQAAIMRDITKQFDVVKSYEIHWTKKNFAQNLARFYGTKLPAGIDKQKHIGTGPFLLIVVKDKRPQYRVHETSKGPRLVNSNTFLSKVKHREMTGGGHRIHATDTLAETEHDLALLLGVNIEDFLQQVESTSNRKQPEVLKRDIAGAHSWESLDQFFYILNATTRYIVMRNFEMLPGQYYADAHGDIDLLVEDYPTVCMIANAQPVFNEVNRVHNKVKIGKEEVLFDFRYLGDGYYDRQWELDLLDRRELNNKGIYVPSRTDHFYSLLYHALIHKPAVVDDYVVKLNDLKVARGTINRRFLSSGKASRQLGKYMARNNYGLTIPLDQSVYIHEQNLQSVRKALWVRQPLKYGLKKIKRLIK